MTTGVHQQSPEVAGGVLRALRHRPFAMLWSGRVVSSVGDSVTMIALPWLVYDLTGSPTAMASVMVLFSLPLLALLLVAGVVVDRLPRQWVMLASDIARGLTVALLALLVATGWVQLWHVQVGACVFGAAEAFFYPAYSAVQPQLVPRDELGSANSLTSTSQSLSWIAGPIVGAGLIATGGTALAFGFDALTFAVSAAFLLGVRVKHSAVRSEIRESPLVELASGFRVVAASTWLWFTIGAFSLIVAVSQGLRNVVLPQLVRERLGDVGAFGAIQTAVSVGILVGIVAVGQLGLPRRRGAWFYGATVVYGLTLAGLGIAPSLAAALVLTVAFGITLGLGIVLWNTSLQELVPEHLLGRVSSIDMLGSFGLAPIGLAAAGVVAEAVGPAPVFVAGGGLIAVLSAAGLLIPAIRRFESSIRPSG